MTTQETYECHVLVIGSGIAGMSFLETFESLCPDLKVIMTSMTPLMKIARVTKRQGRGIEHLDIQEVTIHETGNDKLDHGQENNDLQCLKSSNFTFLLDRVTSIDPDSHVVTTKKRRTIHYRYVCVCSGGRPDVIKGDNSFILGVRDTASVKTLSARLNNSRKVIIVGNGGIATELVHELLNCHIVWVIKDKNISSTFFDAAASKFFFDCRQGPNATQNEQNKDTFHVCSDKESREDKSDKKEKVDYFDSTFVTKSRRKGVLSRKYVCDPETTETEGEGSALGPDWSFNTLLKGSLKDKQLDIEYETQISEVLSKSSFLAKYANISADYSRVSESDFPAVVLLSNGKVLTCDLVVSATGVIPNTQVFQDDSRFIISTQDGGVLVNEEMETPVTDVFAAGDVCSVQWNESETWHQMRLWTQARQMGFYAAQVVASKFDTEINAQLFFNFETFTHVTYFFGFKVILLGLFNQQKLKGGCDVQIRVEEGKSFVKVILKDGRVKGVTLIGETEMEETFENLIISQMDISAIQDQLLEGIVDLDDYFD